MLISSAFPKRLLIVLLVATATGVGAVAAAPVALAAEKSRSAKAHFDAGMAYFNLERYKEALGEFEQAYLDKQDPSYFFNLAECHRLLGNNAEATRFYQRFLQEARNHPNRVKAEAALAEIEKGNPAPVAQPVARPTPAPMSPPAARPPAAPVAPPAAAVQPAAVPLQQQQPAAPQSTPVTAAPSLALVNPQAAAPAGAPMISAAPVAAPGRTPVYKKVWFWLAIGGAVAVLVLTGVALTATSSSKPSCPTGFQCQ